MSNNTKANLAFAVRFISGFSVGFELMPVEGVYFQLQLGIVEFILFNPEIVESD